MSRVIEGQVVEGVKNDPDRYRVHIEEIVMITGGRLKDRILHHTCSPIKGFLMVEKNESDGTVELIPFSSIWKIGIKEEEMSKTNLGFYLNGVIK